MYKEGKAVVDCGRDDFQRWQFLCDFRVRKRKFKGCVRYIFISLVCMSKREDLWNKEKCLFFFTSRALLVLEIITFLNFQIFKCHNVIKCLSMKHEAHFTEWLGKQHSLVMKFGQFITSQDNFFIIKFYGKCGLETSSRPFFIFKESSVKRNPRRPVCWFGLILIALLLHI